MHVCCNHAPPAAQTNAYFVCVSTVTLSTSIQLLEDLARADGLPGFMEGGDFGDEEETGMEILGAETSSNRFLPQEPLPAWKSNGTDAEVLALVSTHLTGGTRVLSRLLEIHPPRKPCFFSSHPLVFLVIVMVMVIGLGVGYSIARIGVSFSRTRVHLLVISSVE